MDWLATLPAAPEVATAAARALLCRLGRAGRALYPFGNPVSIERVHVPIVRGSPYWIAEKTDGLRMCLLLTRTAADGPGAVSLLVDRMGRMYGIPLRAPEQLFAGSVFDCELVARPASNDHALCVFDVACVDGDASIALEPLSCRLRLLRSVFGDGSSSSNTAVAGGTECEQIVALRADVQLVAKPMWPLAHAQECMDAVARLDHASDGFVLTPEQGRASLPGTAWDVFKVKVAHTIDLKWANGALWYGDADELFRLSALDVSLVAGLAAVPEPPGPALLDGVPNGSIVELTPQVVAAPDATAPARIVFVAAAVRADRDVPNNVVCVTRTFKSVLDAVCIEELVGHEGRHK